MYAKAVCVVESMHCPVMLDLRFWRKVGKVHSRAKKLNCRIENFRLFQELLARNPWRPP